MLAREYLNRLERVGWFIEFCQERIKSLTDYVENESDLTDVDQQMLKIYRDYEKEAKRWLVS